MTRVISHIGAISLLKGLNKHIGAVDTPCSVMFSYIYDVLDTVPLFEPATTLLHFKLKLCLAEVLFHSF